MTLFILLFFLDSACEIIYISLSVPGLFHNTMSSLLSMFSQMTGFPYLLKLNDVLLYVCVFTFLIHLSVHRHLIDSHILDTVNNAAMNMGI